MVQHPRKGVEDKLRGALLLGALLCGLSAPVFAQETEIEDDERAAVLQATGARSDEDRAEVLFLQGKFQDAIEFYQRLLESYPDRRDYQLRLAVCFYETGKLDAGRKIYDDVLEQDPNNVVALLQSARVKSELLTREKDPKAQKNLRTDIQQGLLRAARNGANVLRAIEEYKELKRHFGDDVQLQLRILKAPQTPRQVRAAKNPFRNPMPRINPDEPGTTGPTTGPERRTLSAQEQRARVKRLKELLDEIQGLIEQKDYERIGDVWLEVEEILSQKDLITSQEFEIQLEALERQAADKRGIVQSLLLRAFYKTGERILLEMESALARDYKQVFELWRELTRHAQRMIDTNKEFTKAADNLLRDGKRFHDKAKILERIDQFTFDITGIVTGSGIARAIVNNRVVGENDVVYGTDGVPIDGLSVVTIKRRRIRFRYQDTEFEKPLNKSE